MKLLLPEKGTTCLLHLAPLMILGILLVEVLCHPTTSFHLLQEDAVGVFHRVYVYGLLQALHTLDTQSWNEEEYMY